MDLDRIKRAQEVTRLAKVKQVLAIDPYGCGCTECLMGESVPLEWATDEQLIAMLLDELSNHTGYELSAFTVGDDGIVTLPIRPKDSW
jgi:hypothetical protein